MECGPFMHLTASTHPQTSPCCLAQVPLNSSFCPKAQTEVSPQQSSWRSW